jgi:hypothetical protein
MFRKVVQTVPMRAACGESIMVGNEKTRN